jgi:hypothetical protein
MAGRKATSAASTGKKPDSGPKTRIQQQTHLKPKNTRARLGARVSQLPGWDGKIRPAHKSRTWKLGKTVHELQRSSPRVGAALQSGSGRTKKLDQKKTAPKGQKNQRLKPVE